MKKPSEPLIHIEFFWSPSCPYCPNVQEMLEDLINSELGKYLIIEMIDVDSPVGQTRAKSYALKGVPSLAINGHLKFIGVPHPSLLNLEIRKLVNKREEKSRALEPVQPPQIDPSPLPEKQDTDFSLYT
ncbi:MAG: thioredoxin family protein [Candidatus Helarchaeota archaeon]|nr:thioredoxin family protein [Candidatus Helarchaeota archaeon]